MRLTAGTQHQSGRGVRAQARNDSGGSSRGAVCATAYGSRGSRSVAAPRDRLATGRAPRTSPAPDRGGIFAPCALALRRASIRATAPHNESLQLTGAANMEVVVGAALAGTVRRQHLPGEHVARS